MYSSLAKYYDILMRDVDYPRWISFVAGFIENNAGTDDADRDDAARSEAGRGDAFRGKADRGKADRGETARSDADRCETGGKAVRGADLACGTGNFCIGLTKLGFDVYGVDNSPLMLQMAAAKAKKEGLDISFIQQDINRFTPLGKLDFITCMCDGVNYLKEPQGLFLRAASALKKGGVFIFDISTEYKLKETLAGNTFWGEDGGVTYIWQNSLGKNKDRVHMQLVFFEERDGYFVRSEESQTQYIHDAEHIKNLLEKDFKVKTYGEISGKKPKPRDGRIHFVAVKK